MRTCGRRGWLNRTTQWHAPTSERRTAIRASQNCSDSSCGQRRRLSKLTSSPKHSRITWSLSVSPPSVPAASSYLLGRTIVTAMRPQPACDPAYRQSFTLRLMSAALPQPQQSGGDDLYALRFLLPAQLYQPHPSLD